MLTNSELLLVTNEILTFHFAYKVKSPFGNSEPEINSFVRFSSKYHPANLAFSFGIVELA